MLFQEKEPRFSPYIKHMDSESATEDGAVIPKLSMLRVEMERVHPGMSDFILRVSTPKYAISGKTGTILSIRGTKSFTKYEKIQTLAETICAEMEKRKDATFQWDSADRAHLTDMLYGTIKFFTANMRVEQLRFTTEALA